MQILYMLILALLHMVDLSPLETSKGIYIYIIYFNFFPLILSQSTLLLVLLEFHRTHVRYQELHQACKDVTMQKTTESRLTAMMTPRVFSFVAMAGIE